MNDTECNFVTYNKSHEEIINNGIEAISDYLIRANESEKRSLLLCLDKFLDPYYGYKLTYFNEIIILLQKNLFVDHSKVVKEDLIQLITDYSLETLDYLADNIDSIEPELLSDAINALGSTYNMLYLPIFIRYENHGNGVVQESAKEALIELKNKNK
ncbi:hypothetical protein [Paenibacillus albiflavus]|nr:hypothetical protein [Paenibacillus albiflavus]